jgi:hypothetical protein
VRYALAVLTHGDNADVLERTITSFDQHVSPPPVWRAVYQDGPCALPPLAPYPWVGITGSEQLGFCEATRRLWSMVADADADFDYVFWLEHDFEFLRAVNVDRMAAILADDTVDMAQVALMRTAVNESERRAGGLAGEMRERGHALVEADDHIVHRAFFTTNPMLMTRSFMRWVPFPDNPSECEGRFGYDLRQAGYRFAFMGQGEPWVEHIGQRTGKGY